MRDPIDEIREALAHPDFLERIDAIRGYDVAEKRLLDRLEVAESARRDDYQNWMTALDRNAELLAKLEAAEKTNREWLRANAPEGWIDNLRIENEALRAKIKAMEQQEPVAWLHETRRDSDVVTDAVKHVWGKAVVGSMAAYSIPLYARPDAKGE